MLQIIEGLDHIANFLNSLDTEGMTAKEVRTAIYTECLKPGEQNYSEFFSNETGVFKTRKVYHDDVDYIYWWRPGEDIKGLLKAIRLEAKAQVIADLRKEFSNLTKLLGA